MSPGGELPNHRTLHDAGIYRSGETLLLEIKGAAKLGSLHKISSLLPTNDVCVSSSMLDSTPKNLRHIVHQARRGFALGLKPDLVLDGSGGAYFLNDARKVKVAVFKPADEEPYAENNPRGYVPQGDATLSLREGINPGELCLREVAAYLLDHGGFSSVPMTTLAEARHPAFNLNGARMSVAQGGASLGSHSLGAHSLKAASDYKKVGSFQEFVRAECTMDDLSPSKISVDEVHKIAILDIRIMNADRNAANLLCRRRQDNSIELVPIDHGFSLRSIADVSWMDWCWLDWPQLKEPLSEKSRDYILKLDIDADVDILREKLNICQEAIDYFRASSKLLQEGVKGGLSLYDIATMCCRNDNLGEIPSKLEILSNMAIELATTAVENGRWHHSAAVKAIAEQLSPVAGGSLLLNAVGELPIESRFIKSASSANFSCFTSDLAGELAQAEFKAEVPGMANSSASDESSDVGDAVTEQEEREEWAAAVIADVSMDQSISVIQLQQRRRSRSHSVAEDESVLSSSPKGFWCVRPGNSALDDNSFDNDSFSWSPRVSPHTIPHTILDSMKDDFLPISALHSVPDLGPDSSTSPTVTFAPEALNGGFLSPPPSTINVTNVNAGGMTAPLLKRASSGGVITRSKSYSALSENGRSSSLLSNSSSEYLKHVTPGDEGWKNYFTKFVDLVIIRETFAVARTREVTREMW